MELKSLFQKLDPFRRHKNIKQLVDLCQRRMTTLQSLKYSATKTSVRDNSALESLYVRLKQERLLAQHLVRVKHIISRASNAR